MERSRLRSSREARLSSRQHEIAAFVEREERVMGELPDMAVRVGDVARIAAPEGRLGRLQARSHRPRSTSAKAASTASRLRRFCASEIPEKPGAESSDPGVPPRGPSGRTATAPCRSAGRRPRRRPGSRSTPRQPRSFVDTPSPPGPSGRRGSRASCAGPSGLPLDSRHQEPDLARRKRRRRRPTGGGRRSPVSRPPHITRMRSARARISSSSTETTRIARPSWRRATRPFVDELDRADVDASRRLARQHDLRIALHLACQHDLLLVARRRSWRS